MASALGCGGMFHARNRPADRVRISLFGLRPKWLFGLGGESRHGRERRGSRGVRDESTLALYRAVRASCIAARLAFVDGDEEDVKFALVRVQRLALELARRAEGREIPVEVVRDDVEGTTIRTFQPEHDG